MKTCVDCGSALADSRSTRCMGCAASTAHENRLGLFGLHLPSKIDCGRPMTICADCRRPIARDREVCGACDWERSRPERLERRAARRAA